MACDGGFGVVLAFCCFFLGIILDNVFRTLYNRFSSPRTNESEQHINNFTLEDRRTHRASEPKVQAICGNPNYQSNFEFPPSEGAVLTNYDALFRSFARLEGPSEQKRNQIIRKPRSEPSHGPYHLPTSGNSGRSGAYNVNKKTRAVTRPSLNVPQDNRRVGEWNGSKKSYGDNDNASSTNIKGLVDKAMPNGLGSPNRPSPVFTVSIDKDAGSDIDDLKDVTSLKMLTKCPDDIRELFKPCNSSRTIQVRQKKLVYVCKIIGDGGGQLELEKMGISLFVPPGAIPFNQRSLVSLALNWDLSDNPVMEKKESLVSPVVYCGPHCSTFDKPCVLRFKHCAHDTRFAKVLTSETDLFEAKNWQDMNSFLDLTGSEVDGNGDSDEEQFEEMPCVQAGVSISVNECEVEVPHFSLFTCIMGSKHRLLKKWIQVAVFTHDIGHERNQQQIRVYFLNKTPCALQWAIRNEAQHNYSLACPDTTIMFMESGENMKVQLHYISNGWEAVSPNGEESIGDVFFEQIWHGKCPHMSMCFQRLKNTRKNPTLSVVTETEGEMGHNAGSGRLGDSEKETIGSSQNSRRMSELECVELNIILRLSQERLENQSVPLEILVHNFRVNIMDTQVKVIDEGPYVH